MSRIPEWLRSFLLTFIFSLVVTASATDFEWTQQAIIAAILAAGRTAASGLLPGGSFGNSPIGGPDEGE